LIEQFLDTPVQKIPAERRQEGKVAKEQEIYQQYKKGEIGRADAITALKRWEFEKELEFGPTDITKDIAGKAIQTVGIFGQSLAESSKFVQGLIGTTLRFTPRAIAAGFLGTKEGTPEGTIQQAVLGKEPIKGFFKQIEEAVPLSEQLLQKAGVQKDVATGASLVLGPLAVGAIAGLDLTPFAGLSKTGTKAAINSIKKITPFLDQTTGVANKFKIDIVGPLRKNNDVLNVVASRIKTDGTKIPVIRQSGVFAPKEFETQQFKDISGLFGGGSYNLRDASLAFDNVTPQQAAQNGEWGAMTKLSYQADQAVADATVFAAEQGTKIRNLAKQFNVKINEKTGKQLFEALENKTTGLSENIVNLSKQIRTVLDDVRVSTNIVRKSFGKPEMGYIQDYAPHLQKTNFWKDMLTDARTTISDNFDYIIPNAKKNPHALPRLGQIENLEKNSWKLLESYFGAITNDIYSAPVIEQLKAANAVIKSRGYHKMSKLIETHIRENIVGKPGWLDARLGITEGTLKRAGLQKLNLARNTASLAGNVVWTLFVQPASILLTTARAGGLTKGIQNTLGGIIDFAVNPEIRNNIKKLPTIITKTGGKSIFKTAGKSVGTTGMGDLDRVGTKIIKTKIEKLNDFIAVLADSMEYWLTSSAAAAGYRRAKQLGLKGKDADLFADWLGGATQSRYNREARPILMNNLVLRSSFPFQTYAFELYRYSKTLVGKGGGMPVQANERVNQIAMLLAGMYVYNKYSEATTGRTLNTVGSAIPLVGQAVDVGIQKAGAAVGLAEAPRFGSGRAPVAPAEDITTLIEATDAFVNEGNIQPFRKEMIRWGLGFGGVSGAATVNRFIDGMIAVTQGYQITTSGKEAFPVEGVDALFAPFLGPYSTTAGKRYLQGDKEQDFVAAKLMSLAEEDREAAADAFDLLLQEKPELAEKVKKSIEDIQAGITKENKELKSLGVANGERSQAILKEINKLKTQEEKADLWDEYVEKKIITQDVAEQLTELLKN